MLVKELYKENKKVFNEEVLTNFGFIDNVKRDTEILNYMILHQYGSNAIDDEDVDNIDALILYNLYQYNDYLQGVYDSIKKKFDPFEITKSTEKTKRTGKDTDNMTYNTTNNNEINMNNTDNTTITGQNNTYDDNKLRDVNKTINGGSVKQTGTNKTTHTGTDIATHTKDTEDIHTREGYDNIDYVKAIASLYETKHINLYEEIIKVVVSDLLDPIYYFD